VFRTLAALVLLGLALSACGQDPEKEDLVPLSERPSAGEMITDYAQMLGEMTEALDAEFGPRPWGPKPGREGFDRGGCSDDEDLDDVITVYLPNWVTPGRYAEDLAPVLDPVLERHGFTPLSDPRGDETTIRRATDDYGGTVELLEAAATVLSIQSGCHRQTGPLGDFPLQPSGPSARPAR